MESLVALALLAPAPAAAQAAGGAPARQTAGGEYTRYELLAPGSARFKITYDVTATTPGATAFFNPIRKGSVATDESVWDPASGKPLAWTVVSGATAKTSGYPEADAETDYIRVTLPRPVPANGEVRIRIIKTYQDAKSYVAGGDTVAFIRVLSIKSNALLLPPGFEVVGVNYPSQVLTEADGRVKVSFLNAGPDPVSYVVRGRRLP
jgi:hypothetical protein